MNQTSQKTEVETVSAEAPVNRGNMAVMGTGDGSASFLPQSMAEAVTFADMMCKADIALPKFLRMNKGACLAVSMQAYRWGMDPFAVANKAYSVNDRVAYESQLIASVINTRASLQNRLTVDYDGKDGTRKCIVTGRFQGEDIDRKVSSPPFNAITTKNSPLWKSDPDQQLFYYTVRVWARRYVPELIMGVYSVEEMHDYRGPDKAKDITPPAPRREDFDQKADVIEHESPEDSFCFIDEEGVEHECGDVAAYVEEYANYISEINNYESLIGVWETNVDELTRLREHDDNAAATLTEVFMSQRAQRL